MVNVQQRHGERGLEWQDSEKCGRVWKKHDEMFGKSMVKEERKGEIPLNFEISSYFWSFHHAFFRFILNLSALFLQRNRLVLFFSDLF